MDPVKLLHVDASILGANSASRQVTAAVVDHFGQANPSLQVTYRDLATKPLVHLSGEHIAVAMGAQPESAALQHELAESQAVLREFLDADTVVIGAPMYNFGIPSQLKAWIDRVVVRGQTFQYGENGPEGLVKNKRVIVAVSRGGFYGAGTPAAALEHLETYLRGVFAFIGVTRLDVIVAEGLNVSPEQREQSMQAALSAATGLAA